EKNGSSFFKCHAGCGQGDQINFIELAEGLPRSAAIARFLALAGLSPNVPALAAEKRRLRFDWSSCVRAMTQVHLERLAIWRGYSAALCEWLKEAELIGLYDGRI